LYRPKPPRFARLNARRLKQEFDIELPPKNCSKPLNVKSGYYRYARQRRKQKMTQQTTTTRTQKSKKKTKKNSSKESDDEEIDANDEDGDEDEDEDEEEEDDLFVYLVGDLHSLEEDQTRSHLHARGGHYIETTIGQDPWSLGPSYESQIDDEALDRVVNVVTNNSKKQGRWCCCSNTTRRELNSEKEDVLWPSRYRPESYHCHEPRALELQRIDSKRVRGGKKKGRQKMTVQRILKDTC